MGLEALLENGVTIKLYYFFRDDKLIPRSDPLRRVRVSRLALFVGIQLVGFAATFAITQTIGSTATLLLGSLLTVAQLRLASPLSSSSSCPCACTSSLGCHSPRMSSQFSMGQQLLHLQVVFTLLVYNAC
jgi:hypothetical protein